MNKEHIVITGMARTPMGSFQGSLSTEKAPDLGSIAIKGAIKKANIKPEILMMLLWDAYYQLEWVKLLLDKLQ